jgi:glutaredoxin 3
MPQVVMYCKSWCPYCHRARALLVSKGVQVEEIDIEQWPERQEEMLRRSGRTTVPQIFIGQRHVGGCDDIYELDAAGGLDPLLRGS